MEQNQFQVGDKVKFTSWVGKIALEGIVKSVFYNQDEKLYVKIDVNGKNYLKLAKDVTLC